MKKQFAFLLHSCLALTVLFSACKDDPTHEELLSAHPWQLTLIEVDANCDGVYETIGSVLPCNDDDLWLFEEDGTFAYDQGAWRCDVSLPQIITAGTWSLNSNSTVLILEPLPTIGATIATMEIEQLDEDTFVGVQYDPNPNVCIKTRATFKAR